MEHYARTEEPVLEIVNPDKKSVTLRVTLPSGEVLPLASADLIVDDHSHGNQLIDALEKAGVRFYRTTIWGRHDRKIRERYAVKNNSTL